MILITGIDGLESAALDRGLTPTIDSFYTEEIASYYGGNLDKPFTGQAWPSIYCGCDEEKHGIVDKFMLKTGALPNFLDYPVGLFDDLSQDYSVASYKMPMTYPAGRVSGWMLSGFPAGRVHAGWKHPERHEPKEVEDKETHNLPNELPEDYRYVCSGVLENIDVPWERYIESEHRRFEIFTELYDGEEVVFYGSQLIDKSAHKFFHKGGGTYEDTKFFETSYSTTDDVLEKLVDFLDPEYVFGVGDHGGPVGGKPTHSMTPGMFSSEPIEGVESILDVRNYILRTLTLRKATEPYSYQSTTITQEEEKQMKEHLRDMGYQVE